MQWLLTGAYLEGRIAARRLGLETMTREVAVFEAELGAIELTPILAYEYRRAARAARGYATHWRQDIADALIAGESAAFAAATLAQDSRLALGANTEVMGAFNEAREEALSRIVARHPDMATAYVRVWDAAMDNTCDDCASMHGTWVPLGESFAIGTPGKVHPNCHCEEHIEPLSWAVRHAA